MESEAAIRQWQDYLSKRTLGSQQQALFVEDANTYPQRYRKGGEITRIILDFLSSSSREATGDGNPSEILTREKCLTAIQALIVGRRGSSDQTLSEQDPVHPWPHGLGELFLRDLFRGRFWSSHSTACPIMSDVVGVLLDQQKAGLFIGSASSSLQQRFDQELTEALARVEAASEASLMEQKKQRAHARNALLGIADVITIPQAMDAAIRRIEQWASVSYLGDIVTKIILKGAEVVSKLSSPTKLQMDWLQVTLSLAVRLMQTSSQVRPVTEKRKTTPVLESTTMLLMHGATFEIIVTGLSAAFTAKTMTSASSGGSKSLKPRNDLSKVMSSLFRKCIVEIHGSIREEALARFVLSRLAMVDDMNAGNEALALVESIVELLDDSTVALDRFEESYRSLHRYFAVQMTGKYSVSASFHVYWCMLMIRCSSTNEINVIEQELGNNVASSLRRSWQSKLPSSPLPGFDAISRLCEQEDTIERSSMTSLCWMQLVRQKLAEEKTAEEFTSGAGARDLFANLSRRNTVRFQHMTSTKLVTPAITLLRDLVCHAAEESHALEFMRGGDVISDLTKQALCLQWNPLLNEFMYTRIVGPDSTANIEVRRSTSERSKVSGTDEESEKHVVGKGKDRTRIEHEKATDAEKSSNFIFNNVFLFASACVLGAGVNAEAISVMQDMLVMDRGCMVDGQDLFTVAVAGVWKVPFIEQLSSEFSSHSVSPRQPITATLSCDDVPSVLNVQADTALISAMQSILFCALEHALNGTVVVVSSKAPDEQKGRVMEQLSKQMEPEQVSRIDMLLWMFCFSMCLLCDASPESLGKIVWESHHDDQLFVGVRALLELLIKDEFGVDASKFQYNPFLRLCMHSAVGRPEQRNGDDTRATSSTGDAIKCDDRDGEASGTSAFKKQKIAFAGTSSNSNDSMVGHKKGRPFQIVALALEQASRRGSGIRLRECSRPDFMLDLMAQSPLTPALDARRTEDEELLFLIRLYGPLAEEHGTFNDADRLKHTPLWFRSLAERGHPIYRLLPTATLCRILACFAVENNFNHFASDDDVDDDEEHHLVSQRFFSGVQILLQRCLRGMIAQKGICQIELDQRTECLVEMCHAMEAAVIEHKNGNMERMQDYCFEQIKDKCVTSDFEQTIDCLLYVLHLILLSLRSRTMVTTLPRTSKQGRWRSISRLFRQTLLDIESDCFRIRRDEPGKNAQREEKQGYLLNLRSNAGRSFLSLLDASSKQETRIGAVEATTVIWTCDEQPRLQCETNAQVNEDVAEIAARVIVTGPFSASRLLLIHPRIAAILECANLVASAPSMRCRHVLEQCALCLRFFSALDRDDSGKSSNALRSFGVDLVNTVVSNCERPREVANGDAKVQTLFSSEMSWVAEIEAYAQVLDHALATEVKKKLFQLVRRYFSNDQVSGISAPLEKSVKGPKAGAEEGTEKLARVDVTDWRADVSSRYIEQKSSIQITKQESPCPKTSERERLRITPLDPLLGVPAYVSIKMFESLECKRHWDVSSKYTCGSGTVGNNLESLLDSVTVIHKWLCSRSVAPEKFRRQAPSALAGCVNKPNLSSLPFSLSLLNIICPSRYFFQVALRTKDHAWEEGSSEGLSVKVLQVVASSGSPTALHLLRSLVAMQSKQDLKHMVVMMRLVEYLSDFDTENPSFLSAMLMARALYCCRPLTVRSLMMELFRAPQSSESSGSISKVTAHMRGSCREYLMSLFGEGTGIVEFQAMLHKDSDRNGSDELKDAFHVLERLQTTALHTHAFSCSKKLLSLDVGALSRLVLRSMSVSAPEIVISLLPSMCAFLKGKSSLRTVDFLAESHSVLFLFVLSVAEGVSQACMTIGDGRTSIVGDLPSEAKNKTAGQEQQRHLPYKRVRVPTSAGGISVDVHPSFAVVLETITEQLLGVEAVVDGYEGFLNGVADFLSSVFDVSDELTQKYMTDHLQNTGLKDNLPIMIQLPFLKKLHRMYPRAHAWTLLYGRLEGGTDGRSALSESRPSAKRRRDGRFAAEVQQQQRQESAMEARATDIRRVLEDIRGNISAYCPTIMAERVVALKDLLHKKHRQLCFEAVRLCMPLFSCEESGKLRRSAIALLTTAVELFPEMSHDIVIPALETLGCHMEAVSRDAVTLLTHLHPMTHVLPPPGEEHEPSHPCLLRVTASQTS